LRVHGTARRLDLTTAFWGNGGVRHVCRGGGQLFGLSVDGEIHLPDSTKMTSLPTPGHRAMLTAATGGDEAAPALLVRAYHDRVYRFGVRVCRDGFDADDAVQEAFM
jgi:Sigma-70 region 2